MNTTPTDTPETDAKWQAGHFVSETMAADFARTLERRARAAEARVKELEAEAAKWKANHDNQVKLKSLLINRPDLGDRAPRIQKMLDENARLRAALRLRPIAEAGPVPEGALRLFMENRQVTDWTGCQFHFSNATHVIDIYPPQP